MGSRARRRPDRESEVAGVRITHPARVLFPDIGLTKLGLARFYSEIADWILPHLDDRPLTLMRCPAGVGTTCFYVKHLRVWAPEALRRVRIQEQKKVGEYLVVDSLPALISLVQMNILEIHTWNSTTAHLERPDRFILDLDPGPDVTWPQVIEAARLVRSVLHSIGLESLLKTTGSRGLHVVVPVVPDHDWAACAQLARAIADTIVRRDPKRYTTSVVKAGRERKILIDYLRNHRGNTSVAAYSTRARGHAPISVPIRWNELTPRLRSDHWTVRSLPGRLARLSADPWPPLKQRISRHVLEVLRKL